MRKSPEHLPDEISITWHIDDIKARDDHELEQLSMDDCRLILDRLKRHHDSTVGINWEVIDAEIEWFLRDREASNNE